METFSLDGITATTVQDTRRIKANDLYPIKYRVTYMRKQVYYPSGIDLSSSEWKRLPTAKGPELKQQRELIQAGFEKIKNHIKDLFKSEQGFSIEQLNIRLSRGMKNSIFSAFFSRSESLKSEGKIGSSEWYYYAAKSLQKFVNRDLKFSDVTVDFLKKYESFMLEDDKSYTTISMYMRALQAIVNEGKKQGFLSNSQYPFGKGKYEIPEEENRKLALPLSGISEILKYPLLTTTEKQCRDYWFFMYLCNGINAIDFCHLKYSDIECGKISFYRTKTLGRSKTKKRIYAILLPQMQDIINKWGNPDKKADNYIFPILKAGLTPENERRIVKNITSLINKKMRTIGTALNYGSISTYTARHSFATVLKRSGANVAFISESLGHTDLKTTEHYLAAFEDETRIKNAQILIPND